jgi:predicted amidohydrolase YtcJ
VSDETVILPARAIHTIDPVHGGDAVAVRDGLIVGVGALAELRSAHDGAAIDDRYADAVLLPGFVEAHCHSMAGAFWIHTYVGYFDRQDPEGSTWAGCRSIDEVVQRLREAEATLADPTQPLVAWGLDPIYFPGERLVARHLDLVSTTRPILVMHASIHLATVNSALMAQQGIDADTLSEGVPKDGAGDPIGELREPAAMVLAGDAFFAVFAGMGSPEGLACFGQLARNAGVTTLTDLGSSAVNDETVARWTELTADPAFPARVSVFHNPTFDPMTPVDGLGELMLRRAGQSTDKARFGAVKLVVDGSIQGFTARLTEPYLGEHGNGIWVIAPEQVAGLIRPVMAAGLLLHAHCNGDEAVDVVLDGFAAALADHPRADHRATVQHCQLTRPDQYARMAELGLCANLFSNHLWYWGDQHVELTVGPERAAGMNAARSVLDLGIPLSIHSDAAVTPLGSLHVAWCAVNRLTPSGRVLGPEERITVPEALHAITLGAAHQLRMDDEIGSITPGKRADFAVLGEDPFTVDPAELREVTVLGTVLGGHHHPAG